MTAKEIMTTNPHSQTKSDMMILTTTKENETPANVNDNLEDHNDPNDDKTVNPEDKQAVSIDPQTSIEDTAVDAWSGNIQSYLI